MQLARIDGVIVSTVCHPSMGRYRTVICQPINEAGEEEGTPVLAVDSHGAALHSHILLTTDGSATRELVGDEHSPLRNAVCAIVDPARRGDRAG
jgi:microcompartment protein CcmK/EutM